MRRFMLRLSIALLTFIVGVGVAMLSGSILAPFVETSSDVMYLEVEPPLPPLPPSPSPPLAPSSPCNAHSPHVMHPFYTPDEDWHRQVVQPHQYPPPPPPPKVKGKR